MHQPSQDLLIGRVVFNDFTFYDDGTLKNFLTKKNTPDDEI
jgi:hypothetical protein